MSATFKMQQAVGLKEQLASALKEIQLELLPVRREIDGPIPQRPLVALGKAAELLDVSEHTIRNMIDEGRLDAVPGGVGEERKHLRVTTASLRQFVDGKR